LLRAENPKRILEKKMKMKEGENEVEEEEKEKETRSKPTLVARCLPT
jgi:hypothetical protein